MKRTLAVLFLGFFLASCASLNQKIAAISGFAVTQSQLDAARNTYDGTSLVALNTYAGLVRCRTGQSFTAQLPCHDRVILKNWRLVDQKVADGINSTQASITAGDNTGATAAWNLLQNALDTAKQIATASGVNSLL